MDSVYFTTKVASETSFCNRTDETKALLNAIHKNQHTVVVAPRRYGKTSLICHALEKNQNPFARIDLFCVVYEEDICKKVANGISKVVKQITSFSEKTLKIMEECFRSTSIGFKAGQIELKVEFGKTLPDPITQLEDLLEGLEKLAKKNNRSIVLFFDEFQDILKADETNKIQAAFRSVAQHSKYVTYIFSGSSRKMLYKIFDDKSQPLYMLCNKIILERIDPHYFKDHIQYAAKKRWSSLLSDEIVSKILETTESHPFYVNLLCDKLWESKKKPGFSDIENAWNQSLIENKGKLIADLEALNTNRIKVLTTIALLKRVNEPNSKIFLDEVKMPLASTQNAVKYLMNHDYLRETPEGLKLTDPLMQKFIVELYSS